MGYELDRTPANDSKKVDLHTYLCIFADGIVGASTSLSYPPYTDLSTPQDTSILYQLYSS